MVTKYFIGYSIHLIVSLESNSIPRKESQDSVILPLATLVH